MSLTYKGQFKTGGQLKTGDLPPPPPAIIPDTAWDFPAPSGAFGTGPTSSWTSSGMVVTKIAFSGAFGGVRSLTAQSTGKYYVEFLLTTPPENDLWLGILPTVGYDYSGNSSVWGYTDFSEITGSAGLNIDTQIPAATTNSIIMMAIDLDNSALWIGHNGTWQNGASQAEIEAGNTTNAVATLGAYSFHLGVSDVAENSVGFSVTSNLGSSSFDYSVPSGFLSGWGTV